MFPYVPPMFPQSDVLGEQVFGKRIQQLAKCVPLVPPKSDYMHKKKK